MAIIPVELPQIENTGYYVAPVPTLNTWILNVINDIAAGARRQISIAAFSPDIEPDKEAPVIVKLLTAGRQDPWTWQLTLKDGGLKDVTVASDILSEIQAIFGSLTSDAKPVSDYGNRLQQLLETATAMAGGCGTTAYAAPALGYARSQPSVAHAPEGDVSTFIAPSPSDRWSMWVAALAFELDRPHMSLKMIPYVSEILHINVRDLWGQAALGNKRLRKLMAWLMLYNFQGPRLWFGAHEYYNRTSLDIYAAHDSDSHEVINQLVIAYDHVMKHRLSPVFEAIAGATKTCKVKGTMGTWPGLFRFTGPAAKAKKGGAVTDPANNLISAARIAVSAIAADDAAMPEAARRARRQWKACAVGDKTNATVDIMTLQARLESVRSFVEEWDALYGELGWDRKVSISVGEIDITGPQFVLTDGHTYSEDPGKALLGLTPVLSLGNVRSGGFSRKHEARDFDADSPSFEFSVLVVEGAHSATSEDTVYARVAVPGSMWMGESGTRRITPTAIIAKEPVGAAIIRHYENKSPSGYLGDNYPPQVSGFVWDATAAAIGAKPSTVQGTMLGRYKTINAKSVAEAKQTPYYTFLGKGVEGVFYHRFAVMRSLPTTTDNTSPWIFYDEHGQRSKHALVTSSVVDITYAPYEVGTPPGVLDELVTLVGPMTESKVLMPTT